MRNFYLAIEYFTDITTYQEYYRAKDPLNPTPEELVDIIKYGPFIGSGTSTIDHPEFDRLRKYLTEHKFIHMQTNWWNGDTVLKPFKLNGKLFKRDDRFVSASAMKYDMKKWMTKRSGSVTDSKPDGL